MKKIMFSKEYGMEQAVLERLKTMTRRLVTIDLYNQTDWKAVLEGDYEAVVDGDGDYHDIRRCGTYHVGEVVALAQCYEDAWQVYQERWESYNDPSNWRTPDAILGDAVQETKGWRNKMFVKADLMPHLIRITNIKVERLQDISDKDCRKEGITTITEGKREVGNAYGWDTKIDALKRDSFFTPRAAFASLIDKISGKGTWQKNPWVFAYEFELVQ